MKTDKHKKTTKFPRVRHSLLFPLDLPHALLVGAEADSLQQISLQTMYADPILKSSSSRAYSPPLPPSPCLVPRGTYSSAIHTNRYSPMHNWSV